VAVRTSASLAAIPSAARLSLAAIVALGLALRIVSAGGGLWIDEAWSAVLVDRAATPLGVFVAINHDNNHYLNSLWMLALGFGADPLALRSLSIATGTLTILVAAAIGARRSTRHALVTALLFAISPILVNYGSEARGYAPMLLAATAAILVVARWLETRAPTRPVAWTLGALTLVGLLAQLTMLFVTVAIGAWIALTLRQNSSTRAAAIATVRVMAPSIVAVLLVFGLLLGAAAASVTGLQVGDYCPFAFSSLFAAIGVMIATTIGATALPGWAIAAVALVVLGAVWHALRRDRPMAWFHAVAILGLPTGFILLHVANSGIPRYFLLSSIAILLLVGDAIADLLARGSAKRIAGAVLLVMLTLGSLQSVRTEAARRRGDIDAAVIRMRAEAPAGTTVHVDHLRSVAALRVAAATHRYRLTITDDCRPARFALVDLETGAPAESNVTRCARRYARRLARRGGTLSGTDWALYDLAMPRFIEHDRHQRGSW
jgi:hypothetical protein